MSNSEYSAHENQQPGTFERVHYVGLGAIGLFYGYGLGKFSVDLVERGDTGLGVAGLMFLGACTASIVKTGFDIFHSSNSQTSH